MIKRKKPIYINLRLTATEWFAVKKSAMSRTQFAQKAIEHWQSLSNDDRDRYLKQRQHLFIEEQTIARSIWASPDLESWKQTVTNSSLNLSTAVSIYILDCVNQV